MKNHLNNSAGVKSQSNILGLTVGEFISKVFPKGTDGCGTSSAASIDQAPHWPPDLFAVSALLIYRSSAYHRVAAGDRRFSTPPDGCLLITDAEIKKFQSAGQGWSRSAKRPKIVEQLWRQLLRSRNAPLSVTQSRENTQPKWWRYAYALFAIADEACADVGYFHQSSASGTDRWVVEAAGVLLRGSAKRKGRSFRHSSHPPSITSALVDTDVVCVQPKARTPDVGCSLRNLSHNVALLPPKGIMRVHWLAPPAAQPVEDTTTLNLLLIPFPYAFDNSCVLSTVASSPGARSEWGWFNLKQAWLGADPTLIIRLVKSLLVAAESEDEKGEKDIINGILFPEYALNFPIYESLAEMLRDEHPSVQFLVSGSSSNCAPEDGNYALASHFFVDASEHSQANSPSERMMATVSRPKHHRWSLEESQIKAYGLETSFPNTGAPKDARWWEKIPLKPREIHVNAVGGSSVFSAMICEDLARSDPAHEPLRAVGPNLVFVLLMDGPQLEWRWSARYSTGLAEDPGSSVLTLTSRALVERWNLSRSGTETPSWSIAIWKDEESRAYPIECPPGFEGIVLRLKGDRQTEQTLDGRCNMQTYAWHRMGKPRQLKLDRTKDAGLLNELGLT